MFADAFRDATPLHEASLLIDIARFSDARCSIAILPLLTPPFLPRAATSIGDI